MGTIITAEKISKAYQLGQFSTGTLSQDIQRWVSTIFGKEDSFSKIGEINSSTKNSKNNTVWSLKDISFEIKQGDIVGIIGKNGAGKSTLLKILSQVTAPTIGTIKVKGRIASLLEVGTGFHPELTGRENIFLNGAILGMRKAEISKKLDEIIAFSGVERYIDTPVKRYSSGMFVRLAFAVAAHLESEILIVDEVLAVGDAEFQQKCLGKMKDVSKSGRSVLFVSHNLEAVKNLCNKGMLLNQGRLLISGDIDEATDAYMKLNSKFESTKIIEAPPIIGELPGYVTKITILDDNENECSEIPIGQKWKVKIKLNILNKINHFIIGLGIKTQLGLPLMTSWSSKIDIDEGVYEVIFEQSEIIISTGVYSLTIGLSSFKRTFQYLESVMNFSISEISYINDDRVINTKSGLLINQMDVVINKI
jgi:lipopolysaccharide transport system ATP-binding protein